VSSSPILAVRIAHDASASAISRCCYAAIRVRPRYAQQQTKKNPSAMLIRGMLKKKKKRKKEKRKKEK
jgi:hypothetical protein